MGVAAAAVVAAALTAATAGALSGGAGHPRRAAVVRYGGLPSWLPKAAVPVNRIAQASPAHPWLAIEGDTVSVHLPGGQTMATAVGPAVPEEGQFPVPPTTRCTFTVTFASTTGVISLNPRDFTIVDELGRLHHVHATLAVGGVPPRALRAGPAVTLMISDVLPTGNGQLRWTPAGSTPVVSWDFDVEID